MWILLRVSDNECNFNINISLIDNLEYVLCSSVCVMYYTVI